MKRNRSWVFGLIFSFLLSAPVFALPRNKVDETQALKAQIKELQDKVSELEAKLEAKEQRPPEPRRTRPMMDAWDPFAGFDQMEKNMSSMMEDMEPINPQVDIKEENNMYIITTDIPGMDKNNIDVSIKGGLLVISGERTSERKEGEPGKYSRQERSFGHFTRSFTLPHDADAASIDASYDKGVLTLKLKRLDKSKPENIKKVIVK